jgi:transcriptional regulator with XRE-family HTH domain
MDKKKFKIAQIFRTTRKLSGLSQKQFAAQLGVTQGTVSKLENATLAPDAALWYLFCIEFGLHADLTYKSGYLFFSKEVQFKGDEFELGDHSEGRFFKVKDLIPFFNTLEDFAAIDQFYQELKKSKMDKDVLIIPEYPLPFKVLNTLFNLRIDDLSWDEFINSSAKNFVQDQSQEIFEKGMDYSEFLNDLKSSTSLFDIKHNGEEIQLSIVSDFRFSLEEAEAIKCYLNYKVKGVGQCISRAFKKKSPKVTKINDFSYVLGLT